MNEAFTAAFFAASGDRFFNLICKQQHKWTLEEQQQLCQSTWTHSITDRFPRNVALRTQVLKRFVDLLESRGIEIHDLLYEQLGLLMAVTSDNRDFHTYFVGEKSISIESHRNIVENATTGLHSWPASKQFAQFALQNRAKFENKSIVELGSGVGLTGIIIASFCNPRSYVFTDHSVSVLAMIAKNVSINELSTKWNTCVLDWSVDYDSFPCEIENNVPQAIIACDVVFDAGIVPDLCRLLRSLMHRFHCEALVLSTVRNPKSIESFEEQLCNEDLLFTKHEMYGRDEPPFYVDEKNRFVLHEIRSNKV